MNRFALWAVLAVLMGAFVAACSGLDFGDVVRVSTPSGIQQSEGLAAKLTLNDAEVQYKLWYNRVQAEGAQWKAALDKGDEIAGMLGQLTLGFLEGVGPELAGIPIVGPLVPGLALLGGYLIRRKGDVPGEKVAKEKEDSYNAGLKAGKELASKVI